MQGALTLDGLSLVTDFNNSHARSSFVALFSCGTSVLAASALPRLTVPPLRRLTFGKRPKSKQKVLPLASGPTSSGSLVPSLLQGPAAKGHPWPIAALAASMPLNPLRNDSTRPPDGAFGVVCEIGVLEAKQTVGAALAAMLLLLRSALPSTNRLDNAVPESRQEAERRCCGEGRLAWMPNEERWARDGPP